MATDRFERKLAAIVAADVVGYSRLMGIGEADTLSWLKTLRQALIEPRITAYHGRIVKLMGDCILAEFPSVVEALACAVEVLRTMKPPYQIINTLSVIQSISRLLIGNSTKRIEHGSKKIPVLMMLA